MCTSVLTCANPRAVLAAEGFDICYLHEKMFFTEGNNPSVVCIILEASVSWKDSSI